MKKIKLTDIVFYITFAAVIIIAVFFDRRYLVYALPVLIVSIGIIYFERTKKINLWYVLSLVSMISCDILIYTNFVGYFSAICVLTSMYFILCTIALKKYLLLKKVRKSTFLSAPMLVCSTLIAYLIYSISQLLIDVIKEAIPEVVLCLLSSTCYILVAYLIYKQDMYKDDLKLVIVAFLCIFIVSLLPINQLFYSSKIFTVFVNIAHVLSLYFFMRFLIDTAPDGVITSQQKYI